MSKRSEEAALKAYSKKGDALLTKFLIINII